MDTRVRGEGSGEERQGLTGMLVKTITGYFWWSPKQEACVRDTCPNNIPPMRYEPNYVVINGNSVQFSEVTRTPEYQSKWDDVVFLGTAPFTTLVEEEAKT